MKPMYNLLIKSNLNNFSVLQARDELLKMPNFIGDPNEARKFIHRQVNHLVASGYLDVTGTGRAKRFTKSALFYQVKFIAKANHRTCFPKQPLKLQLELQASSDYQLLVEERNQYHGELAMSQAEAEEYETLLRRFPEKESILHPLKIEAIERSSMILGKMKALTALLANIEL